MFTLVTVPQFAREFRMPKSFFERAIRKYRVYASNYKGKTRLFDRRSLVCATRQLYAEERYTCG